MPTPMGRTHIRRITAITAAGVGKALTSNGGGAAVIRRFPRWGLALRVAIFILGPAPAREIAASGSARPKKTPRHSVAAFASAGSSRADHLDRKSTRLNSSHPPISYAALSLK